MQSNILQLIAKEFGETSEPVLEDNVVSFEVYRGDFESAPDIIKGDAMNLYLIERFDDPFFMLCYSTEV